MSARICAVPDFLHPLQSAFHRPRTEESAKNEKGETTKGDNKVANGIFPEAREGEKLGSLMKDPFAVWANREPGVPKWHREARTRSASAGRDRQPCDIPRPRKYGSMEKPGTSRHFKFGVPVDDAKCTTTSGMGAHEKASPLKSFEGKSANDKTGCDENVMGKSAGEVMSCDDNIEEKSTSDLSELATKDVIEMIEAKTVSKATDSPTKEKAPGKTIVLKVPAARFSNSQEWGRIQDATVIFEPGRIVVESHHRCGNSKILHCPSLPWHVDTEASTYKIDPDGRNVQITVRTFTTPTTPCFDSARAKVANGKFNVGEKQMDPDAIKPLSSDKVASPKKTPPKSIEHFL